MVTSEEQSVQTASSINDLHPKMCLEGVVKKVELYGAFVDLGLERDGLVHISQLTDRRVGKVSDVVQEGDRVTVWVLSVDADQGRIALTLVKPPEVAWKDLAEGQSFTGRVVRLERYGVFVDFGAERPGLLHVREMGRGFIQHPSELFKEGDEAEVRIMQLDRRKKRIDLTLVDLSEGQAADAGAEEGEPLPTHMELAFHRAQKEEHGRKRRTTGARRSKHQVEQDDILARTLRKHSA